MAISNAPLSLRALAFSFVVPGRISFSQRPCSQPGLPTRGQGLGRGRQPPPPFPACPPGGMHAVLRNASLLLAGVCGSAINAGLLPSVTAVGIPSVGPWTGEQGGHTPQRSPVNSLPHSPTDVCEVLRFWGRWWGAGFGTLPAGLARQSPVGFFCKTFFFIESSRYLVAAPSE